MRTHHESKMVVFTAVVVCSPFFPMGLLHIGLGSFSQRGAAEKPCPSPAALLTVPPYFSRASTSSLPERLLLVCCEGSAAQHTKRLDFGVQVESPPHLAQRGSFGRERAESTSSEASRSANNPTTAGMRHKADAPAPRRAPQHPPDRCHGSTATASHPSRTEGAQRKNPQIPHTPRTFPSWAKFDFVLLHGVSFREDRERGDACPPWKINPERTLPLFGTERSHGGK